MGFAEAAFLGCEVLVSVPGFGIFMDLICNWAMAAVGLDAEVPKLVSVPLNATEAGSLGSSAGTRALIILTCLLLLVWSHKEKKSVPGELITSVFTSVIF